MVILILLEGLGLVLFSKRVGEATVGVAAVGALPLGFQVKLGLVRGKYLPAGLHAAEASYVPSSSLGAFWAVLACIDKDMRQVIRPHHHHHPPTHTPITTPPNLLEDPTDSFHNAQTGR